VLGGGAQLSSYNRKLSERCLPSVCKEIAALSYKGKG